MKNQTVIPEPKGFSQKSARFCLWTALDRANEAGLFSEQDWDNICTAMAWVKEGAGEADEHACTHVIMDVQALRRFSDEADRVAAQVDLARIQVEALGPRLRALVFNSVGKRT